MSIDLQEIESKSGENPFISKFMNFFESELKQEIEKIAESYPETRSLNVDFKELEKFDYELADELLEKPDYLMEAAKIAIENIEVPTLDLKEKFSPHIRFFNLPEDKRPLLRDIGAEHIGKIITIEGLIKQITDVLPKLNMAKWKCNSCGNIYSVPQTSQAIQKPAFCTCRHREFTLMDDSSGFVNFQKLQIQEPLESLKGNDQPTNLDIYVLDDLVNKVSAGEQILITGILRIVPSKKDKLIFHRFIETVHIEKTEQEFEKVIITPEEEKLIKELAADPKIYEKLVNSIAPSIYGHEIVKESIAIQLFGGVQKNLPNGQKIRGNVHILLVGDPGVAKSQMLQAAKLIAPKSIYVAGKTTSAVGLCVAPDSMILNDNGLKKIGSFVEEKFDDSLAVEEAPGVFSNNFNKDCFALGTNLKLEKKNISKIWKIKAPEKMIRIVSQSGKLIDLTSNTGLYRLKNGKTEWIKSQDLTEGDYIATVRFLPEGMNKTKYSIESLIKDKNIRIHDNVGKQFIEITNKLSKKYGSLQEIAKHYSINRNKIYFWRMPKRCHGIPLHLFVSMGLDAGFDFDYLSKNIKTVFLRYGNKVKIPRILNNKKLSNLVGLLFGDGNVSFNNNKASFRFFNSSKELLSKAEKLVYDLFEINVERINRKDFVPAIRFNSKIIYYLFNEFGLGAVKKENHLSHFCTELNNDLLAKVLQGLFDTDGYVVQSKIASSHIGISTISKNLARIIQLSLLKYGIRSKLRERKVKDKISKGKSVIVKSNNNQFYVEIRGKTNLELFNEKIGFSLNKKSRVLKNIISSISKYHSNVDSIPEVSYLLKEINADWCYSVGKTKPSRKKLRSMLKDKNNFLLENLSNSDVVWEKIIKKEIFKPEYDFVYDFTVDNSHNFISNGILVHNTASAVKDEFGEGGWTLKAGALVLASGGICMADELDKMQSEDRSALHEAMEQGMISVAKAGIVTRFKTNTSILAAANPKHSRFDKFTQFFEQIELPPTLISRFDLFFMLRDTQDPQRDASITSHILNTHKAGGKLANYKKSGKTLPKDEMDKIEKTVNPEIDKDLFKKYLSYARQNIFPILTEEAIKEISKYYLGLRKQGADSDTYAATHRQLEGLVRLSEASARVRLSDKVEKQDAERAIKLVNFSLEEVVKDPETGKIDIDIITTGQTHTQLENLKTILRIIKEKSAESGGKVSISVVLDEAMQLGIAKEKANEIINKLDRKGDIYKPNYDSVKPTGMH